MVDVDLVGLEVVVSDVLEGILEETSVAFEPAETTYWDLYDLYGPSP
jgi:hypothetical protein